MAEPLRVGIIGAGWAGASHLAAYSRLPRVTVAALWSRTRARAEDLAGGLNQPVLEIYDRWEDLIEKGGIDAISIAAPPTVRRDLISAALERSVHVLVEKPFTTRLSEARELAQMAKKAKTVTAVSLNWRYSPSSQVVWRAVREGAIGQVLDISMDWRFRLTAELQAAFEAKQWFWQSEMGGGAMREVGSYEFDRARFLTGLEFTKVVSRLRPVAIPGTNGDGDYSLIAELSNGGLGNFLLRFTPGQGEWRTVLFGKEGTLVATYETVLLQRRDDDEPVPLQIPEIDQVPDGVKLIQHTWNRLIADFVAAIRQGDIAHKFVPHLPTFADGLCVQEVVAAAELSEAERRWVGLAELE